LLPLLLA